MPQLDLLAFSSQNLWFLITFVLLLSLFISSIVPNSRRSFSILSKISQINSTKKSNSFKKKTLSWNFL